MANELINATTFRSELLTRKERLEKVLPTAYRHQAERFIERAVLTFYGHEQREKLERCTPISLVQCVLEAAECGFALDNHFVYLIPYGTVAQCEFDFKALVVRARRSGTVEDVRPQVVHENDEFDYYDECGKTVYKFREARGDRGPIIGAYAVATFPGGGYRFTYMAMSELQKVKRASKSPNSPAWSKWEDQMFCKAVIKRCLKGLLDDPGIVQMLEIDNRNYGEVIEGVATATTKRVSSMDSLAASLEARVSTPAIESKSDPIDYDVIDAVSSPEYEYETRQ